MKLDKKYDYKVTAAGRINIIGEHIDYCGGKVFPAALSLNNTIYIRPNGTDKINLKWTTLPDEVTLEIDKLESYKNLKYGNYQAGAALAWKRAGHKVLGCDMLYDCTVPFGSGLSSSAAIEVSTIVALATIACERLDLKEIALLAQQAEREFAGVNCGIMDQYASANGKKNHALILDCKAVTHEYVPLNLGDYALVIINCNKPHNLVESKYNERRAETETALEILKKVCDISCLADLTPAQFEKHKNLLGGKVRERAEHVVYECNRVKLAADAMKRGDLVLLGKLLNESHASLRDKYEVTGKELDALAAAAQSHPDCIGSRMTGAGFGGCTVSLVKRSGLERFKTAVAREYRDKTGYDCKIYDADIADGVTVTKL